MTEGPGDAVRPDARSWGYCSWCGWRDAERLPGPPGGPVEWACVDHWPADVPSPVAAAPRSTAVGPPRRVAPGPRDRSMPDDPAHRDRCRRRVQAMSRDLSRSPQEWVGRESHTLLLAGPLVDVVGDPDAPDDLRAWAQAVLALVRDPVRRRALQVEHLSAAELEAVDHHWDGEG